MAKELLTKSISMPCEVKAAEGNEGALHIKAYAAAFNNVDSWGDIIVPTACDDFLKSEDAARWRVCYQHNPDEVIGVITAKGVDEYGLWFEADILDTTTGSDVQKLLKAGAINEFSIGYYADRFHYEKREGYDYDIRILDAITVVEVSPVTRAANPKAILLDAKSEDYVSAISEMSDDQLATLAAAVKQEEFNRLVTNF